MAALPEALATAEAAMAYAWQRLDEVRADEDSRACEDLLAVIDAVDNNLRAGRRMFAPWRPAHTPRARK
jgi:hypothetical protein